MYNGAPPVIPLELSQECVELFKSCDEFNSPVVLRAFAGTYQLGQIDLWLPRGEVLNCDIVYFNLLRCGKSRSEPVLLDMLNALALKYSTDMRADRCRELKEQIRSALLQAEGQEQEGDYLRVVKDSAATHKGGAAKSAAAWIDEAGDDLDELALRITLAVFHGTTFDTIEAAKDDLLKLLRDLVPAPAAEAPPPPHVPLMRRLHRAGAVEAEGRPPNREGVIELREPAASEVIVHVWQFYRESEWRKRLMDWLTMYAAGRRADVRTRAAVAAGIIATKDYRYICNTLLTSWVHARSNRSQYRAAVGVALAVLALDERRAAEVQGLLRGWARSQDPAERWAAMRAYIYVGAFFRPVKDVIVSWREIAAFAVAAAESVAVLVEDGGHNKVVPLKPMLMSLMDAMMRFFVVVAQSPAEEQRPLFAGILEGLNEWVAGGRADSALGLFMFTTLGQMSAGAGGDGEAGGAPVLLQLVPEGPDEGGYRSQLAGLFEVLMRNGATITDARELLCAWLGWADGLGDESRLYEPRIRALFEEIIAADRSGRARGKLAACLRDCGRNRTARRLLAGL